MRAFLLDRDHGQDAVRHRHVFLDPDPDPVTSYAERQRLSRVNDHTPSDATSSQVRVPSPNAGVRRRSASTARRPPAWPASVRPPGPPSPPDQRRLSVASAPLSRWASQTGRIETATKITATTLTTGAWVGRNRLLKIQIGRVGVPGPAVNVVTTISSKLRGPALTRTRRPGSRGRCRRRQRPAVGQGTPYGAATARRPTQLPVSSPPLANLL
jgi:hypothetical protein